MALSGTIEKSFSRGYTLRTNWSATQNISGNYSVVTCNHYLICNSGYDLYIGARSNSCNVGGSTQAFNSAAISTGGNSTISLGTTTHTINHNADGTASVGISTTFSVKANISGSYVESVTANGTATLNTIPRKSSVTCNSFYIGDSTTINISRASSSFTHTVKYNYGTLSGTIATKTSETSIGWTPPTTFYGQIPNGTTGYGSITCETYSGNTLIGTSTANFNAYAKESDCIPTVSATIVDTNESTIALTGDSTKLIKYLSQPKVTITATAKNSASIKSRKMTWGDGQTSTNAEATFTNGVTSSNVTVSATDSRGYSKAVMYDLTNLWVEYVKLAFSSIALKRPESTSSTVNIKVNGNYFNGSFGTVKNDFTLRYRYKEEGGTYTGYVTVETARTNDTFDYSATLEGIDYRKQYIFEFVVEDAAMVVSSGERILEKGEAIFRVGHDYTRTNGRILDEYGTEVLNGMSKYETSGSIDVNTTIEELVLSTTNTPDSGFWYVKTMFYADKTATSNRTQIAYPYNRVAPTYCRYYVNGTGWSEWFASDIKEKYVSDSNGYIWFGNGMLIQWGAVSITPTSANVVTQTTIYFNKTYDLLPVVLAIPKTNVPHVISSGVGQGSTVSAGLYSMVIYLNRTNTVATNFLWTAIGYKVVI